MAYFITGGHWSAEEEAKYKDRMATSHFVELDGDLEKIGLVDHTDDDGKRISVKGFDAGRPLRPDGIPSKLERKPWALDRLPLLDVDMYLAGSLLVCQEFKDLLEELEPDVHQFWPMDIYVKGEKVALRYWFIACHRIRGLSEEHCYPPLDRKGYWDPSPLGERENDRVVFSKRAIGQRHAWVDKAFTDRNFSDEFGEQLMDLNLTGLRFVKREES